MTAARYCEHCGAELSSVEALFCPSCGASVGMVSFQEAIRLAWQRYFVFSGRSTRAEFWWWALFTTLVSLILGTVDTMIGMIDVQSGIGVLSGLFSLGVLIPSLALGARRLHDINKSGWWQLMGFLIIPMIILLWWAAKPSDERTNKHDPAPRHPTSQQPYKP